MVTDYGDGNGNGDGHDKCASDEIVVQEIAHPRY